MNTKPIRCEATTPGIDCTCVLESGHPGKHMIPNNILKKEDRELWDNLKQNTFPLREGDYRYKKLVALEKP